MRIKFNLENKSLPYADIEIPGRGPLDLTLEDLADALRALGWKMADFIKFTGTRPQEYTADDELTMWRFQVYASLRAAGHKIGWTNAGKFRPFKDFEVRVDPEDLRAAVGEAAEESDDNPPAQASTDSAAAVDAQ